VKNEVHSTLREIKGREVQENREPSGTVCPACGGAMTRGPVPCPDGVPGCLVLHFGLMCSKCGKFWH
jgi:hypothetical protein